jgi:hypothetical protein
MHAHRNKIFKVTGLLGSKTKLDVVVRTCNPSTWEAEAEDL